MEVTEELVDELWRIAARCAKKPAATRPQHVRGKWMRFLKKREKSYLKEAVRAGQFMIIPEFDQNGKLVRCSVSSDSRPGVWHCVDLTTWQCSCEWSLDFNHQGTCRHIRKLKALQVEKMVTPEAIKIAHKRLPTVTGGLNAVLKRSAVTAMNHSMDGASMEDAHAA